MRADSVVQQLSDGAPSIAGRTRWSPRSQSLGRPCAVVRERSPTWTNVVVETACDGCRRGSLLHGCYTSRGSRPLDQRSGRWSPMGSGVCQRLRSPDGSRCWWPAARANGSGRLVPRQSWSCATARGARRRCQRGRGVRRWDPYGGAPTTVVRCARPFCCRDHLLARTRACPAILDRVLCVVTW